MIEITERRIPSSDGIHQLYCRVYRPEGEIKGLFHVVHGMCEHIRRYDAFMREMAEQGLLCYGFDNLGHGCTVNDDSELGYPGKWEYLVEDVQNVSRLMKQEYGEALPCYLLGHSMGSFICRCAASPKIWNKAVIMGTGGPDFAAKLGLNVIRLDIRQKGDHAVSLGIEKLIFGTYNKHFRDENDRLSWLSNRVEVRDNYRADKLCGFHFTLNGFYTLVKLHTLSNSKTWFKSVSDTLPILLVSGAEDPVGDYGKGVTAVYEALRRNGKNVRMKLYDGCRHEILNEPCREELTEDILQFIMKQE